MLNFLKQFALRIIENIRGSKNCLKKQCHKIFLSSRLQIKIDFHMTALLRRYLAYIIYSTYSVEQLFEIAGTGPYCITRNTPP